MQYEIPETIALAISRGMVKAFCYTLSTFFETVCLLLSTARRIVARKASVTRSLLKMWKIRLLSQLPTKPWRLIPW